MNQRYYIFHYLLLLLCIITIDAKHFNGGTIRWVPVNLYSNLSTTTITIMQSYWWSYPTITCAANVPISTAGRSSQDSNLTCVTDCSTDGGYSTKPVDILTDCISVSSSLGMLTSQRSINTTLTSNAHFYLSYVGSAWAALNYPVQSGLQWSITTYIDLRMRSEGFINTPPIASVASPQYAIVNKTTQIQIPVSDVNVGDDIRCRWSTYTPGYRRRKRWDENEERTNEIDAIELYKVVAKNEEIIHRREKRFGCGACNTLCAVGCSCICNGCTSTTCTGSTCTLSPSCGAVSATTTVGTTTTVTTTVGTTTVETPGTLEATSSYPNRQPIDECGGICYPGSVPNGTTLSNCTLSFTGLQAGAWYGIAIQVEDFINTASTTPMSSVPVQFLIYVLPQPTCSNAPIILPLAGCLELTVGVMESFNLSVLNMCNPTDINITDIIIAQGPAGMLMSNLTTSSINASLVYGTFTWTPQTNQIGLQQLCVIAYTSEQVQSNQYCVSFTVITSLNVCATTTTTTTATSSLVSTTSTVMYITSTGMLTTSTVTSITSTGATFGSTVTSTASSTSSTKTAESTAQDTSGKALNWGLIAGLSSLGLLLLLLLCYFCCLYCCVWLPGRRRRRQEEEEEEKGKEEKQWQQIYTSSSIGSMTKTPPNTNANLGIQIFKKNYPVYADTSKSNGIKTSYMIIKNNPVIPTVRRWPL